MQYQQYKWFRLNGGEPLGNVVIEGLASGIKQIVTDDGGIKEMVKDTDATIISTDNLTKNLYYAMNKIISNKEFNKKINYEKIKEFSEVTYSKKIFEIFKEIWKII